MYFCPDQDGRHLNHISLASIKHFYDNEITKFLNPKLQNLEIGEIDIQIISQILYQNIRFIADSEFYFSCFHHLEDMLTKEFSDEELMDFYHNYKFFEFDCWLGDHPEKDFFNKQLELIFNFVTDYYLNEYFIFFEKFKYIHPNDYFRLTNPLSKIIFKSSEGQNWFIETIEEKFDLKNENLRGFNAYLKAIIDDEDVKQFIFNTPTTQKQIVEFVNEYYERSVIKNSDKLSDPAKHSDFIKYRISEFKKNTFSINNFLFRIFNE